MEATAFNANNLRTYLFNAENHFSLDLSKASVIDIINEHIKVKETIHPHYRDNRLSLIKYISLLENEIGLTLMPCHITDIFYNQFVAFMQSKGMMLTSIKSVVNDLRCDLTWSARYKVPLTDTFDCIDIPKFHREQISLSMDEVSWIYHFPINILKCRPQLKRSFEQVRDMFVLSCNLGQRHSDMIRISRENFNSGGKFTTIQQKTKQKAIVDISRLSMSPKITYDILNKYDYKAPYKYSLGNYNRHLHNLLQLMDWTELINRSVVSGNLSYQMQVEKYRCISSHTARRTFASINYLVRKFPAIDVMKATGHADEKSFHHYICASSDTDE